MLISNYVVGGVRDALVLRPSALAYKEPNHVTVLYGRSKGLHTLRQNGQ